MNARFVPTCGPADGLALELYASDVPFTCDDVSAGIGPHVEIYFGEPPPAGADRETTYTWGPGTIYFTSLSRCPGVGAPCIASSSGTVIVRRYFDSASLVVEWSATFPDGTTESGMAAAEFCPRDLACG